MHVEERRVRAVEVVEGEEGCTGRGDGARRGCAGRGDDARTIGSGELGRSGERATYDSWAGAGSGSAYGGWVAGDVRAAQQEPRTAAGQGASMRLSEERTTYGRGRSGMRRTAWRRNAPRQVKR
jgi:hypothetical protein